MYSRHLFSYGVLLDTFCEDLSPAALSLLTNEKNCNVLFKKISIHYPQKGLEFSGGFCKAKKFKEMYEA